MNAYCGIITAVQKFRCYGSRIAASKTSTRNANIWMTADASIHSQPFSRIFCSCILSSFYNVANVNLESAYLQFTVTAAVQRLSAVY